MPTTPIMAALDPTNLTLDLAAATLRSIDGPPIDIDLSAVAGWPHQARSATQVATALVNAAAAIWTRVPTPCPAHQLADLVLVGTTLCQRNEAGDDLVPILELHKVPGWPTSPPALTRYRLSDLYDADLRTRDARAYHLAANNTIPHPLRGGVFYAEGQIPCTHAKKHGRWDPCPPNPLDH